MAIIPPLPIGPLVFADGALLGLGIIVMGAIFIGWLVLKFIAEIVAILRERR